MLKAWQDPSDLKQQLFDLIQPVGLSVGNVVHDVEIRGAEFVERVSSTVTEMIAEDSTVMQATNGLHAHAQGLYTQHLQPRLLVAHAKYESNIQPHVRTAFAGYVEHVQPKVDPIIAKGKAVYVDVNARTEDALSSFSKLEVALAIVVLIWLVSMLVRGLRSFWKGCASVTISQRAANFVKSLPFVNGMVQNEMLKVIKTMKDDVQVCSQ